MPLMLEKNPIEMTKMLIAQSIHVSVINADGVTLLHWAVNDNNIEITKLLLENGANVNAVDCHGLTPLACTKGSVELAKLLLENGANINAVDFFRATPLHWACEKGYIELAKLLIREGANVNAVDFLSATPLHCACEEGHIRIAELLIGVMLSKNPNETKPIFIKEHQYLSAYWDEQIIKIKYLPQEEIIGSKTLTDTILNKISSGKNDTLVSHSFHQLFKSLNPEAIKNQISKTDQLGATTSPRLS